MKVKVALSDITFDHKPTSLEYQELYKSFTNCEIEPIELVGTVACGGAFSNWTKEGMSRGAHSWECVQYVGVDLEKHKDAHIDIATRHKFYQLYGSFSYTTLSHQWDDPRCRLVFLLTEPMYDVELWHWGALAIAELWQPASDLSSADRGRSFLGNPFAEIRVTGNVLDAGQFEMLATQRQRRHEEITAQRLARYSATSGSERFESNEPEIVTLGKWVDRVCKAPHGERNNKLNRAAFLAGRYLRGLAPTLVEQSLIAAGISAGLDSTESEKTVRGAFERGRRAI